MRIPRERTKQPLNSSLASKRKSPIQNTGCVKFENSRATQIQYPSVVSADDTRGAQRVCKIYTAFQLKMEVAAAAFIPTSPSLRNSSKIDTGEMGPRQHEQEQCQTSERMPFSFKDAVVTVETQGIVPVSHCAKPSTALAISILTQRKEVAS